MKKTGIILGLCLWALPVQAQMPYMEEVKALGAISGQGLACGSTKYDTFELLARAILLTKSPSDKLQNDAIYAYSEAKANAYMSKEMDGFLIVRRLTAALRIRIFLRPCCMLTVPLKCRTDRF